MTLSKIVVVGIILYIGCLYASIIPSSSTDVNFNSSINFSNVKCYTIQLSKFLKNCSYIGFILDVDNTIDKKGKFNIRNKKNVE